MTWKILHRAALRAIACSIGLYAFAIAHINYLKDDLESSLIVVGLYLAGVFLILSGLAPSDREYIESLEDTVDILSDPDALEALKEAEERLNKKDYLTTDQMRKTLGLDENKS